MSFYIMFIMQGGYTWKSIFLIIHHCYHYRPIKAISCLILIWFSLEFKHYEQHLIKKIVYYEQYVFSVALIFNMWCLFFFFIRALWVQRKGYWAWEMRKSEHNNAHNFGLGCRGNQGRSLAKEWFSYSFNFLCSTVVCHKHSSFQAQYYWYDFWRDHQSNSLRWGCKEWYGYTHGIFTYVNSHWGCCVAVVKSPSLNSCGARFHSEGSEIF